MAKERPSKLPGLAELAPAGGIGRKEDLFVRRGMAIEPVAGVVSDRVNAGASISPELICDALAIQDISTTSRAVRCQASSRSSNVPRAACTG